MTTTEQLYGHIDLELPDKEWMYLLRERGYTADSNSHDPRLDDLKKKILSFTGVAVCLPGIEEDIDNLLLRGKIIDSHETFVSLYKGVPSHCHRNACFIWEQDSDRYQIWTGYAMSDDGVWRQHSWIFDLEESEVVETTTERLLYFGFAMSNDEASEFCYNNLH